MKKIIFILSYLLAALFVNQAIAGDPIDKYFEAAMNSDANISEMFWSCQQE